MTGSHRDEDDLMAAEYALGLLEGDDLTAAQARMREDSAFAGRVAAWERQLASLADELAEEQPSSGAKAALMARLFADRAASTPLWRRAWPWQVLSGALAAAVVAMVIGAWPVANDISPLRTAEIASDAGDFRVVAVVDELRDEVILTRTEGAAPEGRILQVWAHGPGEPAQSVGLWPEGESVRLALPPEIAAVRGVLTLGVSEEPPGGSPTGSPTGRVFGTVDIPGVGEDA